MTQFDLAIRDGVVVHSKGRAPLDVYVREGRIGLLAPHGSAEQAAESIDARGRFVLPGFVDTHVHLMDPGDPSREDFPTGTGAAAVAGVTTIVEHTHAWPVRTVAALREKEEHLRGRAHVDFGLAAHLWPEHVPEIGAVWEAGAAYFKAFTCETHGVPALDAGVLSEIFETLTDIDGVCLVHCEDDAITAAAERRLKAAGRTDPLVIPAWRSRSAELVATSTVVQLALLSGARVSIAHVSHPAVLELILEARRRGADLTAETCPQYLCLHEEEIAVHAGFRKFTPPARIRTQADEDDMWRAFGAREFDYIASDHAPATSEQKCSGDIWSVHFGLPGLDTTGRLMIDAALRGRTSFERVAEAYAEVPARRFGLRGKGAIEVGADGDLAIVDPDVESTLSDAAVHSRAGWTPFAGRTVRGAVVATVLRGRVIARDGALLDLPPAGRFLPGAGHRG